MVGSFLKFSTWRETTELSKYIWDLKDRKKSFRVKWRIFTAPVRLSALEKLFYQSIQNLYIYIYL